MIAAAIRAVAPSDIYESSMRRRRSAWPASYFPPHTRGGNYRWLSAEDFLRRILKHEDVQEIDRRGGARAGVADPGACHRSDDLKRLWLALAASRIRGSSSADEISGNADPRLPDERQWLRLPESKSPAASRSSRGLTACRGAAHGLRGVSRTQLDPP